MSVRVAAIQCGAGIDRRENLATVQRLLDEAASQGAELAVLPEFCNHASWYDDQEHAWQVAVEPGDDFLSGIATKAAEHQMWVVVNATRRDTRPVVRGSNFLFDPSGELVTVSDKQVLMGAESDHLSPAERAAAVVDAPYGPVAMYSCMDGVINETPRGLALRGAQILCNSLNSFAEDEATLHVPVRAAENRVWVVAANKVGPLIPQEAIEMVSEKMGIPVERLHGAGEAQIVAPDGTVVARGPQTGEAVVVADIDPARATDKTRPDGTDVFAARRPELYVPIGEKPHERTAPSGPSEVTVAAIADPGEDVEAVIGAVVREVSAGASVIVLPELAGLPTGPKGWVEVRDTGAASRTGQQLMDAIAHALVGTDAVVATTVVDATDGVSHLGVVVGAGGLLLAQPQLHRSGRHPWVTTFGDRQEVVDSAAGRLTLVVGGDDIYPETFRLAVLQDAEVALVSTHVVEEWETTTGLVERSAENRLCLVGATRSGAGASLVCTLEQDFTLWTEWQSRAFDGRISHPIVHRNVDASGPVRATVHPARTTNRVLTRRTDLVSSRPWWLVDAITSRTPAAATAG